MSRRPQITDHQDQTARVIDVEIDDMSQVVEDEAAEENDIASEFGRAEGDANIYMKIHKHIPKSKDMIYCMDATSADLPILPKLQEGWGEGKYRIVMYRDGKIARRWTVLIAALPKFRGGDNVATNHAGNDPRLIALLERLVDQQQHAQQPAPQTGMRFGVVEITGIITAAVPVITLIKDLMPKPVNQMQLMKDIMEITAQFQGDNSREPSTLEVISNVLTKTDILSQLGSLVPGAAQPQPQPQPQRPAIPGPQVITPEQQQHAFMAQVKAQLTMLVTRAQKNSDPGLYAELIIDNFPEEFVKQLAAPGAIEFVVGLHPPCATFRPWFEILLTSVADQLGNGVDDDANAEGEPAPEGSPIVSKPHSADRVIFDPVRFGGDARDVEDDGEAGAAG